MTHTDPTPRVWPWNDDPSVVPRPAGFALGVTTAEVDEGAQQLKDALARVRDDLEHTCRVRRCNGTLAGHVTALYVAGVDEQAEDYLEPRRTPYLGRHRRYVVNVARWATEASAEHVQRILDDQQLEHDMRRPRGVTFTPIEDDES